MTDVRLTATNPTDSSVVPVACNAKGELLITDPKIEKISNNVVIEGLLRVDPVADARLQPATWYSVSTGGGSRLGQIYSPGGAQVYLATGGYRDTENKWVSYGSDGSGGANEIRLYTSGGAITFHCEGNVATGSSSEFAERFRIDTSGGHSSNFFLHPDGFGRTGERVINVGEELVFLRAQVKALMEKLKMSPEGGWPVWDGSD